MWFGDRKQTTVQDAFPAAVNMVPLQVALGIAQGIMPLVSYNYASGNRRRMKDTILFTVKLSLSFLVIIMLGYYLWAGTLISLFMKNEAIIAYGSRFLRGLCLTLPFLCMEFIAVSVFQACGMGKKSLVFAILRKIVLEIPALVVLNYFFPLYGLPYAQPLAEVILAIAAVVVLKRMFSSLQDQRN